MQQQAQASKEGATIQVQNDISAQEEEFQDDAINEGTDSLTPNSVNKFDVINQYISNVSLVVFFSSQSIILFL